LIDNDESIITDKVNDSLTTENEQLYSDKNSRISLFKLDKSTSMHSLLSISRKSSNIFEDLFIVEKNSSKNSNLGKHEHWISNAMASYLHPFHDHPHQPCFTETDKKII